MSRVVKVLVLDETELNWTFYFEIIAKCARSALDRNDTTAQLFSQVVSEKYSPGTNTTKLVNTTSQQKITTNKTNKTP